MDGPIQRGGIPQNEPTMIRIPAIMMTGGMEARVDRAVPARESDKTNPARRLQAWADRTGQSEQGNPTKRTQPPPTGADPSRDGIGIGAVPCRVTGRFGDGSFGRFDGSADKVRQYAVGSTQ